MKLWQVKWFKLMILIVSGLLAVGITFVIIYIHQNSNFSSPTPPQNFETPLPSLQGHLPEPKALGVKTKDETNVPILMYHHIQNISASSNITEKNLSVSPAIFKDEIKYLSQSGYSGAVLDELFDEYPQKRIVITFDDGYKDIIENALPVLKEYGFRGVVFVIVDNIGKSGYMNIGDLNILINNGWEIGSHSLTHPSLKKLSEDESKKQITESKKILENIMQTKINYFCFPAGKYNEDTIEILKSTGYVGAVTIEPGKENLKPNIFELKRIRIEANDTLSSFKAKLK